MDEYYPRIELLKPLEILAREIIHDDSSTPEDLLAMADEAIEISQPNNFGVTGRALLVFTELDSEYLRRKELARQQG